MSIVIIKIRVQLAGFIFYEEMPVEKDVWTLSSGKLFNWWQVEKLSKCKNAKSKIDIRVIR